MRPLILALSILATPALAEEPATLILPTPVVSAIMQRLAQDPAVQMLQALQQCIAVQVPGQHGECPAVEKAMQTKAPPPVPAP